jgi:hypothetical protein
MKYERTYKLRLNAEQCRKIIRLDLQYNFNGVVKSEINENHYQFKNLAYKTSSVWDIGFDQVVSIQLTENINENSTSILISAMPTSDKAFGDRWQNALEQLVEIVWNDIYRAADSRYPDVVNAVTNPKQKVESSQATERSIDSDQTFNHNVSQTTQQHHVVISKKNIWIGIAIVAVAVILAIIIIPQISGDNSNSSNGISIVQEELITSYHAIEGNHLFPILAIKVKNTSKKTKKVSFEANFYADDNLLGSAQADYVTLAPGDETILFAQSDKGYVAWSSHQYTYKITKWWVFDQ